MNTTENTNTTTSLRIGIVSTSLPDYTKQVCMTLAEIAYSDPQNIQKQLSYPHYATQGKWKLLWLGITAGNQMYVCQSPGTGQWVVVIRGSVVDPWQEAFWVDWFTQDLNTLGMTNVPFGSNYNNGALISYGTLDGFSDLLSMTNTLPGASYGQTLVDFLKQNVIFDLASIVVVGHSLGGCLASVLAPYLYETLCRPKNLAPDCVLPVTFAAPTAGDNNFAAYVNGLFDDCPYRCMNDNDVIPHSWDLSGLNWILDSYPLPKGPVISDLLWGLVDATWWLLYEGSYNYTQPGPGNIDNNNVLGYYWWFMEAAYQHSGETYLSMYGAPNVVFPLPSSPVQVRVRRPRPTTQA
ncbi:MAG: lipase family protein [Proteobacteria bacterium]|nr:MAG: lipase family protein [Pseudomonadota bacterium]